MRKIIFGKVYSFITKDLSKLNLRPFLELYEDPNNSVKTDVIVEFTPDLSTNKKSYESPKTHETLDDGFIARYDGVSIRYRITEAETIIYIALDRGSIIGKLLSPDYSDNYDILGTLLHELVFVPLNFLDSSKAVIHSSGSSRNNQATLIGGTGGVGKSSLELIACRHNGRPFICDDIAIIDQDGLVHANLAYPKIYGYNTIGDKSLLSQIKQNMTLSQRLHWFLKSKVFGLNRVRKALPTNVLYQNVAPATTQLAQYYLLQRSETASTINLTSLTAEQAAHCSLSIIETEYFSFFQHLHWHESLCCANGIQPIITMKEVRKNLLANYLNIFSTVSCELVSIPKHFNHSNFIQNMTDLT